VGRTLLSAAFAFAPALAFAFAVVLAVLLLWFAQRFQRCD
jgi:hypothetical protein